MRNLVRGARKLFVAPRDERRRILSVLVMTPRIARSLKLQGYASTRAWLEGMQRRESRREVPIESLKRADTAIRALPWKVKCLERSLAIWWIAGDRATIRLGVAPSTGSDGHRFHAWVERDGVVVNDAPDVASEFLPLVGHSMETPDPQLFD